MNKPLHITAPHAAQAMRFTEDASMRVGQRVGNQLFTLYDTTYPPEQPGEEAFQVTMTGEELDSLCAWWASYRGK
jgi:hypothetical protein